MKEIRKPFKIMYSNSDGLIFVQTIIAPTAEKARQMFLDSYTSSIPGDIVKIVDIYL